MQIRHGSANDARTETQVVKKLYSFRLKCFFETSPLSLVFFFPKLLCDCIALRWAVNYTHINHILYPTFAFSIRCSQPYRIYMPKLEFRHSHY